MNSLLHYGTLCGLIFSTGSVAAALLLQQRQTNATIYLELTARLAQLYRSLSVDVRAANVRGEVLSPEQKAEVSVLSYEYFSLICSAYQLYRGRYFSGSLWYMLRRDFDRTLATPLVRLEWERQRPQFASFPHFTRYVQEVQEAATP
jgi:hypothetical protein